jgi:hypothetical protein
LPNNTFESTFWSASPEPSKQLTVPQKERAAL